jgi:hypothetical protein
MISREINRSGSRTIETIGVSIDKTSAESSKNGETRGRLGEHLGHLKKELKLKAE